MGEFNTGIPTTLFDLKSLMSSESILDCADLRSSARIDSDQAMVYVFVNKDTNRLYIGSTINLSTRLHTYIHS